MWSNAGRHTLTTGAVPLVWSELSCRLFSVKFILSAAIIASGLNFFAFAGRNFGSMMSLKRLFNADKPASSSSGGQTPAPTPNEAPALCWNLALVGVPNSAKSSSCASPARARPWAGLRPVGEPSAGSAAATARARSDADGRFEEATCIF